METILIIEAKMTEEQLEVLVSEIKKISEIIGIKLTFKSEEDDSKRIFNREGI